MSGKVYKLRSIIPEDLDFLYLVYAGTREWEMELTGWSQVEIDRFLQMQFKLQHTQYLAIFPEASFDIIYIGHTPAGRLYVDRQADGIYIVDVALLPSFQRQGIGTMILKDLIAEADERGVPLRIHVERNNPALPFYIRLGFTVIEDMGVHYFMERPAHEVKSL